VYATYKGSPYGPYSWSYDGPKDGGMATDTWGESLPISVTYDLSTFKNHGDYVSQQGGDAEAAHSPIGKPITSNK